MKCRICGRAKSDGWIRDDLCPDCIEKTNIFRITVDVFPGKKIKHVDEWTAINRHIARAEFASAILECIQAKIRSDQLPVEVQVMVSATTQEDLAKTYQVSDYKSYRISENVSALWQFIGDERFKKICDEFGMKHDCCFKEDKEGKRHMQPVIFWPREVAEEFIEVLKTEARLEEPNGSDEETDPGA